MNFIFLYKTARKVFILFLLFFALSMKGQPPEEITPSTKQSATNIDIKEREQRKNIIKASIISPFVKIGSFFYERSVGKKSTFQIGIDYASIQYKHGDIQIETEKLKVLGITPEYRFYISKKKIKGFYIAAYVKFQKLSLDVDYNITHATSHNFNTFKKYTTFGGGLLIGKQWLIADRISIDLFVGPRYNFIITKSQSFRSYSASLDPEEFFIDIPARAGINLGVAF
jgi:hypothetical protein